MIEFFVKLSAGVKATLAIVALSGAVAGGVAYFNRYATKDEVAPIREAVQKLRESDSSQTATIEALKGGVKTMLENMLAKPPPRVEP